MHVWNFACSGWSLHPAVIVVSDLQAACVLAMRLLGSHSLDQMH